MASKDCLQELTTLTKDHQLTMSLALQVFTKALDGSNSHENTSKPLVRAISTEEMDIAHYIGGAVISKLQKKSINEDKINVLRRLASDKAPEEGTLLHAKSCGKLTNMTSDSKGIKFKVHEFV